MLKTMQHVITNGTVVAQADHRKAFCRQCLMPQTPERLGGVWSTVSNGSILGVTLYAVAIMHAHLIEVLGNGPPFVCDLIQAYEKDELDAVYLLYNEFKSAMVQQISLVQLLPLQPRAKLSRTAGEKGFITPEHLFEPSRPEVLQALLPRYLAMQIWRALLESEASEHGARMTAMDSATKNASEMIGRLTLDYNRARQAAITKELMEIVSGAEALK